FFFQAEDGIRDDLVTVVQTCALPISGGQELAVRCEGQGFQEGPVSSKLGPHTAGCQLNYLDGAFAFVIYRRRRGGLNRNGAAVRSEERRVGKECRARMAQLVVRVWVA